MALRGALKVHALKNGKVHVVTWRDRPANAMVGSSSLHVSVSWGTAGVAPNLVNFKVSVTFHSGSPSQPPPSSHHLTSEKNIAPIRRRLFFHSWEDGQSSVTVTVYNMPRSVHAVSCIEFTCQVRLPKVVVIFGDLGLVPPTSVIGHAHNCRHTCLEFTENFVLFCLNSPSKFLTY